MIHFKTYYSVVFMMHITHSFDGVLMFGTNLEYEHIVSAKADLKHLNLHQGHTISYTNR